MRDGLVLDTVKDLYDTVGSDKTSYELFRRKIRRLEEGNEETLRRLLRKAGLLEDGQRLRNLGEPRRRHIQIRLRPLNYETTLSREDQPAA